MCLVGAFSVIVKTDCETDGSSAALLSRFLRESRPKYLRNIASFVKAEFTREPVVDIHFSEQRKKDWWVMIDYFSFQVSASEVE